jgi:hypothetical protein
VAKEFENRYRGFSARGERPPYPATLIGLATAHNSRKGYSSETPVLIGNEQSARQVLRGGGDHPPLGLHRMSTRSDECINEALRIAPGKRVGSAG